MRRRLFWTIAGVATVTGFLVLLGSVVATQRAAVEATRRELERSSEEVVAIADQALNLTAGNRGAVVELFRVLEGERVGPFVGLVRRAAGTSELAFGVITADGDLRASADLFQRVTLDTGALQRGEQIFLTSAAGELVLISPLTVVVGETDATLVVALARQTPVVQVADIGRGLLLLALGILGVSAILARVLSGQLADRLSPLAGASRSLAAGDLTVRVPDLGDPELNEVAGAFNEMAGELERTRERERQFLLGIGHDLRTPLTTIAGYAEALEAGEVEHEELGRIGSVVGRQSRQMGRLIEDLTLLARLEQPEFDLRLEAVDVGAHIREVAEAFQPTAEEAGLTLRVEVEPGLIVSTDPDRLAQITQNLVENAMRFTPEAGELTVTVDRRDDRVRLSVADTGVGIDPDDLAFIFDRHFVGRRRGLRREGSGLGLSIVKGLADRMGAQVSATSGPGRGSTFTVSMELDA